MNKDRVSNNNRVCEAAARSGNPQLLKYVHELGYPFGSTCDHAAGNIIYYNNIILIYFIVSGSLDCLIYAHKNGAKWFKHTCVVAAGEGNLNCLKYLHENGCEWESRIYSSAIRGGHLDCLKYIHKNGCDWDKSTCASAVSSTPDPNRWKCLLYALENGCELTSNFCVMAASKNNLEVLKFAIERGCEWGETALVAARYDRLDILKYAIENGCPLTSDVFLEAEDECWNYLQIYAASDPVWYAYYFIH